MTLDELFAIQQIHPEVQALQMDETWELYLPMPFKHLLLKVRTIGLGSVHVNPMVKYVLRLKDDYNRFNPVQ